MCPQNGPAFETCQCQAELAAHSRAAMFRIDGDKAVRHVV